MPDAAHSPAFKRPPGWLNKAARLKAETNAERLKVEAGTELTAARGSRSLRDVAGELGVAHVNLVNLEQGNENPTLERLARVAAAYGGRFKIVFIGDEEEPDG